MPFRNFAHKSPRILTNPKRASLFPSSNDFSTPHMVGGTAHCILICSVDNTVGLHQLYATVSVHKSDGPSFGLRNFAKVRRFGDICMLGWWNVLTSVHERCSIALTSLTDAARIGVIVYPIIANRRRSASVGPASSKAVSVIVSLSDGRAQGGNAIGVG